jgi:glutaredoxin
MKLATILIGAAAMISGTLFAAQLYRWVDEKGNVEYRDTPPPANAKKIESRAAGGGPAADTTQLPYAVQVAVKSFPVTLWVSNCGPTCDQAKAHLAKRGVPYSETDPTADIDAFQKMTGSNEVPVLYVGRQVIKGYLASTYDEALDAAGYPRTPPPGFKPAAKPTTAAKAAEKPAATDSKETAPAQPAPEPAAGGPVSRP